MPAYWLFLLFDFGGHFSRDDDDFTYDVRLWVICSGDPPHNSSRMCFSNAALMKPEKSGCGWFGFDWNSGWNWQAM